MQTLGIVAIGAAALAHPTGNVRGPGHDPGYHAVWLRTHTYVVARGAVVRVGCGQLPQHRAPGCRARVVGRPESLDTGRERRRRHYHSSVKD